MQATEFIATWAEGSAADGLTRRARTRRPRESPYPDRVLAREGSCEDQRPAWLAQAHEALDAAVAAVYGWGDCMAATPEHEILRRLLAHRLGRAAQHPG